MNQFDNLCKLAALICKSPRAIIVLKIDGQLVLKASFGIISHDYKADRDYTLSSAVMDGDGYFEITNMLADGRFLNHPYVIAEPFIRSYFGVPLVDEQGQKIGAICVSDSVPKSMNEDQKASLVILAHEVITHISLKRREQELETQHKRLKELVSISSISPEIHAILDFSGKIIFANQAVTKLLEYTMEEATQTSIWHVCHPEDLTYVKNHLENGLRAKKKDFQLDFRIISKSGIVSLFSWNMVVREDRWYTYGRDITERKRVENTLTNLSFVASKVNNAIVINDANNHVTWVNEAFEKITGYTLEDLKGRRLGDLISGPKTDVSLIEEARELNKRNESFTIDLLAYRKDKKPIWVSIYNTLILNDEGNPTTEVEIIIDITDKKIAEQEMMEAKEQALQLSEAKEMFLSVMSHEIRTPLNAILGITHLLMENNPRECQLNDLNILKFSGENLLNIVNDILDFTKMETGNLQLESVPFSLRNLVNDILTSLQVSVAKKNNVLRLSYDERIPDRILGDKTRLYQVLMNLLGNAIKFTENGEVMLLIKMLSDSEHEVVLYFEISDTGIGIAWEKQKYVFESFTQAESDISRKYGGTGLGLAITKKLLNIFGSEIILSSAEGQGSIFSFHIAFDKIPVLNQASVSEEVYPLVFEGKRILIVDDNEINVLIAKRILGKWGLTVDVAGSGREAIEKVKNAIYDLVFMDVKMPDMDGFETTGLIRKMEGDYFKTLPIIALTASSLDDEFSRYKESSMNGHLMKPLNPGAFKNLLLEFFVIDQL
ncbi:PAS domain S-box protein [Pedobacter sp.]|uniref:PAS domain S-box protein n=1 Tax=Pedobacter sp. TaxID=1411316 RepID=UPI003D7F5A8A